MTIGQRADEQSQFTHLRRPPSIIAIVTTRNLSKTKHLRLYEIILFCPAGEVFAVFQLFGQKLTKKFRFLLIISDSFKIYKEVR
jgi:hypothetical protein